MRAVGLAVLQVLQEGMNVPGHDDKLLMDVKTASALTGLSVGTLYHWVSQRRIPYVRLSARCLRFRRCDIEAWITEKVVEADAAELPRQGLPPENRNATRPGAMRPGQNFSF